MGDGRRIVSAAEMDKLSPQDRAAAVDAGVVRDWNDVDKAFRRVVDEKAQRLADALRSDAERLVQFLQAFFDELESELPDQRGSDGSPSATDFLPYDNGRVEIAGRLTNPRPTFCQLVERLPEILARPTRSPPTPTATRSKFNAVLNAIDRSGGQR